MGTTYVEFIFGSMIEVGLTNQNACSGDRYVEGKRWGTFLVHVMRYSQLFFVSVTAVVQCLFLKMAG
jgi:hypothetical protein